MEQFHACGKVLKRVSWKWGLQEEPEWRLRVTYTPVINTCLVVQVILPKKQKTSLYKSRHPRKHVIISTDYSIECREGALPIAEVKSAFLFLAKYD